MEGGVALSCEHQEGRPCGNGAIGMLELDSSAGYGTWLSAFSQLRAQSQGVAESNAKLVADRLYLSLELGPGVLLVGRNPVIIGPGRHTQLVWGDNPPPLDQVSLSVLSLKLPSIPFKVGEHTFGLASTISAQSCLCLASLCRSCEPPELSHDQSHGIGWKRSAVGRFLAVF
jgi:hypothetical protein